MTATHITQSLLNNVARTDAIVAMSNSTSSTPCPAWLVWFTVALIVAVVGFTAWVIWDTWC